MNYPFDVICFAVYLLAANLIAFAAFGADKYFSIKNTLRISEKRLLALSIAGGSAGAILGQKVFRHKTRKFKGILWIILTVHLAVSCGIVIAGMSL